MPITDNVKNEMRFEFDFGSGRIQEAISKKIELRSDEDDPPHISAAFVDWMDSVGYSPEILSVFLTSALVSQSDDPEMCISNITGILSALEEVFFQSDTEDNDQNISTPNTIVDLHDHINSISKGTNPVRQVMTYEQFVDEFQREDSFRKYMYNVYAGEMTE